MGSVRAHIRNSRRLCVVASASFSMLVAISTLTVFPISSRSDFANAITGTSNPSTTSLTLAAQHNSANVNITAISDNGTFISSDTNETASFTVTTNNYSGYTLGIVADDDNGLLSTTSTGNESPDTISSISTITSAADFSANTSAAATSYNNKWGYKPNKYVSNNIVVDNTGNNTVFLPSPTTTMTTLDTTSMANQTDSEYEIGLGVRADYTTAPGSYSNTFTLVALANPVAYNVTFNKNTNDTVTNMPSALDGSTSSTGINVPNITPTRANYTFAGWCNRKDAINVCPTGGTTYQPNATYGIDQTADNTGITLYALWQPNYYMQDVATWGTNLAIGESVQAIDRRDGKIYWVTKEETDPANPRAEIDVTTGKAYQIWMTQNLDLDLSASVALTPDLSGVSTSWTPVRSTRDSNAGVAWVDDNYTPYSYNPGTSFNYTNGASDADNTTNVDYNYSSLADCTDANHLAEECAHYSVGNYYNWSAALASNDTSLISANYIQTSGSICPAGWRLPTGLTAADEYSDFGYLLNKNGVTTPGNYGAHNEDAGYTTNGLVALRDMPLWVSRSGQMNSTGIGNVGTYSIYWTSSSGQISQNAYLLALNSMIIRPGLQSPRYYGASIRCVARPARIMQEVDSWGDELAVGETTQAADIRDNKVYWVTKEETDESNPRALIDESTGKAYQIWMTQDLELTLTAGNITYTHSDTDLGYTSGNSNASWTPQAATDTDIANWTYSTNSEVSLRNYNYYYPVDPYEVSEEYSSISECTDAGYNLADCSHFKAGVYYNYYAIAALGASDTAAIGTEIYSVMPNSICPAGWRLPSGFQSQDNYSDFGYLLYKNGAIEGYSGSAGEPGYTANGTEIVADDPLWMVRTGQASTSGYKFLAGSSYIPSNTLSASDNIFGMDLGLSGYASPDNNIYRMSGRPVRCVARASISNLSNMQDFAKLSTEARQEIINGMETNKQYEIEDSRDGKTYTIAKLENGDVWMTQHLDLDGGTTVTPSDSNVTSNYTLPNSDLNSFGVVATDAVYNSNSTTCTETQPCYSYYSYSVATAGTNPETGVASYDICPKGWRLPSETNFRALISLFGTKEAITSAPWNGVLSGRIYSPESGPFVYGNEYASLWASGSQDIDVATNISYGDRVGFWTSGKYAGFSVRCILDNASISDISTMQEFGSLTPIARKNVLESMVTGQQYTVSDSRDSEVYSIARLADNQVWLLDNLRLDLTNATVQDNLTSATTNASNTTLSYLKGTTMRDPSTDPDGQYATAGVANWTSSHSYSAPLINTASKNTTVSYAAGQSGTGNVGVYYNFCAATAGSYCYGNGTSAGTSSGNATEDICPKGWRLPTGGDSGEYQSLYTAYSSDGAAFVNALRTPLSGRFYNGSAYFQGSYGNFWSSTRYDISFMYGLYVYTSGVSPQDDSYRNLGHSVRCVLNTSLQDATADVLWLLIPDNEDSATLSDKRDNEKYTIARISDGSIWMTKNLDLAGGTTITTNDSNVTESHTLPASNLIGFTDNDTEYVYNSGLVDCASNQGCYSYYSYPAATAGTNPSSGDSTSDICPKGWHLPSRTDFLSLFGVYNTGTLLAPVWKVVYSGHVNDNAVAQTSTNSYYWTSTVQSDDSTIANRPYISASETVVTRGVKASGYPVRCIKSN